MELIDSNHIIDHKPLVATIGFFDGVHRGHRYLIDQLLSIAKKKQLASAVITFPVHPRRALDTDFQPALLCGYEEKLKRLSETGLDYSISLNFTKEMSMFSARDFIHKILKEELNVSVLLIGYDHRFGHNRSDGFEEYKKYGAEVGIEVVEAQELDSGFNVSSSHIRRCLAQGDIEKANDMLGYKYTISGQIVEGFKVGRTIGFPTANIKIWEDFKVVPALGVYAVHVNIGAEKYKGMLYIGNRPTLHDGGGISLEVNIFDFDDDLYGKTLSVEFIEFVRLDEKFPSLQELVQQIHKDKETVKQILKRRS